MYNRNYGGFDYPEVSGQALRIHSELLTSGLNRNVAH